MKIDLKRYALKALERAKEDLRRDKYLLPVAFIVTDEDLFDYNIEFENAEQKASVYRELVEIAKQRRARAIITVNDATISNAMLTPHHRCSPDMSNADGVQECIFVSVSGPGIRTWSVCLPYLLTRDHVEFGNPNETENDILNLLPAWPPNQTASA